MGNAPSAVLAHILVSCICSHKQLYWCQWDVAKSKCLFSYCCLLVYSHYLMHLTLRDGSWHQLWGYYIWSVSKNWFRQFWFGLGLDIRKEILGFSFVIWKNSANLSVNTTVHIERTVSHSQIFESLKQSMLLLNFQSVTDLEVTMIRSQSSFMCTMESLINLFSLYWLEKEEKMICWSWCEGCKYWEWMVFPLTNQSAWGKTRSCPCFLQVFLVTQVPLFGWVYLL